MFGTLRCCLILDSGAFSSSPQSLVPSSLLPAVLEDEGEVSSSVAASPELTAREILLRD